MKDSISQKRHKDSESNPRRCLGMGMLRKVTIGRTPIFNQPDEIIFTWECQACHDTFQTRIPYLEIHRMGPKDPLIQNTGDWE